MKPLGWDIVVGAAMLGAIAAVAGLRVWRGRPINPRNSLETENKLAILTVTLLPASVMFLCWFVIGLVSEAGAGATGTTAAVITLIEVVCRHRFLQPCGVSGRCKPVFLYTTKEICPASLTCSIVT